MPEFAGRRVVIDGISRFELQGGLISDYRESVNGGLAMVQLGVAPARLEKVLQRWSRQLIEQPATQAFLAVDLSLVHRIASNPILPAPTSREA